MAPATLFPELEAAYVECRRANYGHAWDLAPGGPPNKGGKRQHVSNIAEIVLHLRCTRCTTTKTLRINRITGERLGSPSYDYPEGYSLPAGIAEELTTTLSEALRVEFINRHVNDIPGAKRRARAVS